MLRTLAEACRKASVNTFIQRVNGLLLCIRYPPGSGAGVPGIRQSLFKGEVWGYKEPKNDLGIGYWLWHVVFGRHVEVVSDERRS